MCADVNSAGMSLLLPAHRILGCLLNLTSAAGAHAASAAVQGFIASPGVQWCCMRRRTCAASLAKPDGTGHAALCFVWSDSLMMAKIYLAGTHMSKSAGAHALAARMTPALAVYRVRVG